jgi:hypothetical protein
MLEGDVFYCTGKYSNRRGRETQPTARNVANRLESHVLPSSAAHYCSHRIGRMGPFEKSDPGTRNQKLCVSPVAGIWPVRFHRALLYLTVLSTINR